MKWKPGTVDTSLQMALSSLRNTILDLGLDNPLINYKESASRGLFRLGIAPQLAYTHLVTERNQLAFTHDKSRSHGNDTSSSVPLRNPDTGEDPLSEIYGVQPQILSVPTFETETDLHRRLLATFQASKASMEEEGAVTLYITLGMLKWRDQNGRDEAYSSPLLLIPVQLERASGPDTFRLSYTGDDVIHNGCLYELMRSASTILPEAPHAKNIDLSSYFEAVQKVTGPKPHWFTDINSVSLGFFDCSQMAIYHDMDPANWPATSLVAHPIVGPLLGFGSFPKPGDVAGATGSLDERAVKEKAVQVLEADSSQLQSMLAVGKGDTVVIQGPPGTGKTQTIVNIIAKAVADRKTVLVVSNKVAALDLVQHRLDAVGLGEIVLDFRNTRAREGNIFQQLRRTLDLRSTSAFAGLDQAAIEQAALEASQRRLNQYCAAVNDIAEPSGESAYSLYSPLMKLTQKFQGKTLPDLELPEAISWTRTDVQARRQKLEQVEAALSSCGVPSKHPFWGTSVVVMTPPVREKLRQLLLAAEGALIAVGQHLATLSSALGVPCPSTWEDIDLFVRVCAKLHDAPSLAGINLNLAAWALNDRHAKEALQSGEELAAIHRRWSTVVAPHAWHSDVSRLKDLSLNIKGKWWKSTTRDQAALQEGMAALVLGGFHRKENTVEIIDAISKSQTLSRRLNAGNAIMLELYKKHWRGESSNWSALRLQFEWIAGLKKEFAETVVPSWATRLLEGKIDRQPLARIVEAIQNSRAVYLHNRAQMDTMLGIGGDAQGLAVLRNAGEDVRLLQDCFSLLVTHIQAFGPLSRYLQLRSESMDLLGPHVLEVAETWENASKDLLDLFEYRRLSVLLENIFSAYPFLAAFDPAQHSKAVSDFKNHDCRSLQSSRSLTAATHIDTMRQSVEHKPKFEAIGAMSGRAPHLSLIRSLIAQFGGSIQRIKPVFMMNPHSVAALLPTESLQFDLVIFEDANQLRPVDAIGSIARGLQVVVVGDSKQLPPARSARAAGSSDSILDLFCSRSAPQHVLRWHYRSQHESLIALSNKLFYDDQIIVFPSPDSRRLGAGLISHHIVLADNANMEAGKDTESKTIVKAVMEYAERQLRFGAPERKSLGVVTVTPRQRDRIEKHIEQMRTLRPDLDEFFSETANDRFFVKDIENVQGDERDTIFISVGFGNISDTSLVQALGPLLEAGGERRLNVLFTRARRRCEVFTTVRSADISVSEKSAAGLAAFKMFLNFAEFGQINKPRHLDRTPALSFEVELAETIERFGYTVQRRVAVSGFVIDLVIVDPQEPKRFVMGVLCDGPTYSGARTTRERDRLREEVLTNMGWTLYRVWSTGWFLDRKEEEQKLATALARATHLLESSEEAAFILRDIDPRIERSSHGAYSLKSSIN